MCTEEYPQESTSLELVRNPWIREPDPPVGRIWRYLELRMGYVEPIYKDPMFIPYMKALWPAWMDLSQVWVAGGSDVMADHRVLLVGNGQQMLKATPSYALVKKLNGMEAGLLVNTWFDQLSPVQAT